MLINNLDTDIPAIILKNDNNIFSRKRIRINPEKFNKKLIGLIIINGYQHIQN